MSDEAIEREKDVADVMEGLVGQPDELDAFLRAMPKGADLHSHLVGAAATESLIRWGADDNYCVDTTAFTVAKAPCEAGMEPLADANEGTALYQQVLGAWSMEGHKDDPLLDRHQHFFDAFNKFGPVTWRRTASIVAELQIAAAEQNIHSLELMATLGSTTGGRIAEALMDPTDPWDEATLEARRLEIMDDSDFEKTIGRNISSLSRQEEDVREILGCESAEPPAACDVDVRYVIQTYRTQTREYVFGQFVYAFELARRDERIAGFNLVQAEEDPSSLANYEQHMLAIDLLSELTGNDSSDNPVHVTLHAGELIPELLPDTPEGQEHLTFHIRRAVEAGRAERIGHGVDIAQETDSLQLRQEMAEMGVAVEVCLTSNDDLLDVSGAEHPLVSYLDAGVPVALSTDDEGILRSDLTDEFARAVTEHGLRYSTLKALARNSIEHSFAPGALITSGDFCDQSLYDEDLEPECAAFLDEQPRAAAQWRLERAFEAFEEAVLDGGN